MQARFAARCGRSERIEPRALDQTFFVASVQPDASPPMTPPRPERPRVVRDDAHRLVDAVLLAVEAHEFFARLAETRADRTFDFIGVVDVQRPAAIERDVVRHVDERIDRPQADGFQPVLQPCRATGRSSRL